MTGSVSNKTRKVKITPEHSLEISREFSKKPVLAVLTVFLLFNFFMTLAYFIDTYEVSVTSLYEYFSSFPIFGFSLLTPLALCATLAVMFIGSRFFPDSAPLYKVKDYLLVSTCGVAAVEATFYISVIRKEFISFGYTPRHSAFLAILEVFGIAAICISLLYGANLHPSLLCTVFLCPLACLLRLIPSFVYVRDFMQAQLETIDWAEEDFLTPFLESLNEPLFTLQLLKIALCLLMAGFAGIIYYHFTEAKKQASENN